MKGPEKEIHTLTDYERNGDEIQEMYREYTANHRVGVSLKGTLSLMKDTVDGVQLLAGLKFYQGGSSEADIAIIGERISEELERAIIKVDGPFANSIASFFDIVGYKAEVLSMLAEITRTELLFVDESLSNPVEPRRDIVDFEIKAGNARIET